MKENTWEECLENCSVINIIPKIPKINSLLKIAKARISFLNSNKLTELNACFILEGNYTSALEILHALLILNGFEVNNHICLGYYLRDILLRKDLYRIFEDCRYKRNSIIYYGKFIDFEIAKEGIKKISYLIKELEKILKKPKH